MDIAKARSELLLGKTIYDMNLRVVDYGRVSTDKDDQLNSLENQVKYFDDMISGVSNWTHVSSYSDEGISGTQVYKREMFLKMIEDARLGKIDLILTKEVSRFARNTIDSIKYTQLLLSYGVIVFFISDNINTIYPDSEFRLTLMASMAQDEVRKLSERVKFGIRRSIKDEKVGGGGIYGYEKKNGKLTIIEEEAAAVRMVFTLYSSGEYGFKKIGEILAREGYYTRKGKIFSDTTLKIMLTNPRYKGFYTANLSEVQDYKTHKKVKKPKEEWIVHKDTKGNISAIVSEELWDKANELYNKRNSNSRKFVLNKQSSLEQSKYTSKIFCMEHNSTFIKKADKRKHNDNPIWVCNEYLRHGVKACESPILYEKHLDEIFSIIIKKIVDNKEKFLKTITNEYMSIIKENNSSFDTSALEEKIKEQKLFKDKLFDMSLRNLITDPDFKEKNDKINLEIKKLTDEFNKLQANIESTDYYDNIREQIEREIKTELDIKNNIGKYFRLFIDKVFVSKVDGDRKHVNMKVIYNFKKDNDFIDYDFGKKAHKIEEKSTINHTYKSDLLKCKYLVQATQQPWICSIRSKIR